MPAQATGLKAVCCGIEGDLHELPIHLGEIIFESEGWDISNLGPNTPLFTLRDMVAQKKPDLVCISARSIVDLDRATTEYAQLRKVIEKINGTTVLGGEAFPRFEFAAAFSRRVLRRIIRRAINVCERAG